MLFAQGSETQTRLTLSQDFEAAMRIGWFRSLGALLTGKSRRLQTLKGHPSRQQQQGTQFVPIDCVRGTEGRSEDFDVEFYPLQVHVRERWVSVMKAMLDGVTLPPVELIRVGSTYYVRDGHHRLSVARALGQEHIEARVIEWN